MADAVSYQLINKTGSQLDLVATVQSPPKWLPAAPATIAAGAEPSLVSSADQEPGAIVFGYSIEGSSTDQFWVIGNMDGANPQVAQFAPSGHSIDVSISGDSEDGFVVTLTYQ